jgi:hypothetical protein
MQGISLVQFSLMKLLLFVAVISLSLATFGAWGIAVTLVLAQTLWIRNASDRVGAILGVGLVFVLASCVMHGHREAGRWCTCMNNLKTIGLALLNYHDQYGQFPPQYVADAEGRPMHSWRVLILPYLQEASTSNAYQQYRFNEPWNSPHNQKLAAQVPRQFRCRTTDVAEPETSLATHYVAVTGPGTAWPGSTGTRLDDFVDGSGNTVLLVEIADSDIPWMEPRDVAIKEVLTGNNGARVVPSSHHYVERTYFFYDSCPLVGNVLMADASCHCLTNRPSREDLAALLSIAGHESVDNRDIFPERHDTSFSRLDATRCIGFALYLALFALLVWKPPPETKGVEPPSHNGFPEVSTSPAAVADKPSR